MSSVPKFKFEDLKKTSLGFPSEWKTGNIRIHYRYGIVTIFVDEKNILETEKHWESDDLGGFMSDEELKKILEHHELLL